MPPGIRRIGKDSVKEAMTADQPADQPPESPKGGTGRRKPPTIELTATEVEAAPASAHEPPKESVQESVQESNQESTPESIPESAHEAAGQPVQVPAEDTAQNSARDSAPATPEESAPPAPPPPPRRAGRSVGALLGAGVVGSAVGAGALWMAGPYIGHDGDTSALDAKLAGLELQVREMAAQARSPADARGFDDLASRLAKLEGAGAAVRPGTADPSIANRITTLEGDVKAIGRRNDELATVAGDAGKRAAAAAAAVDDLTQKVARAAPPGVQKSDLDALSSRVAAVELGEKAVEAALAKRPPVDDRAARLAIAATALKSAVERGDAFATELAAAKSLGADPKLLAALDPFANAGLPKAAALARALSDLQPALLQAAGAAPRGGGFLDKLQLNAEKLVRIRPTEEVAGSDPAAIIARAEVKTSRADFAGALAELATLPEAASAPAAAWIKQAQMRVAALDAVRQLTSDALAGLGK